METYRVLDRWSGATHIEGVVSASGLLFLMKGHRSLLTPTGPNGNQPSPIPIPAHRRLGLYRIGSWAKAANVVLSHQEREGIPYPSRRRVTPRHGDGRPRPFPTLVDITIHEWRLVYST